MKRNDDNNVVCCAVVLRIRNIRGNIVIAATAAVPTKKKSVHSHQRFGLSLAMCVGERA